MRRLRAQANVAVVLEWWKIQRIVAELDLTTAEGLHYATMLGVGFMVGARPGELYYTDKEDFSFAMWAKGVDWALPFSKADQGNVGVYRGIQHRTGCTLRPPVNDGGKTFCVACAVKAYLDLTGKHGVMWPSFTGVGAASKSHMGAAMRQVCKKINEMADPKDRFVNPVSRGQRRRPAPVKAPPEQLLGRFLLRRRGPGPTGRRRAARKLGPSAQARVCSLCRPKPSLSSGSKKAITRTDHPVA